MLKFIQLVSFVENAFILEFVVAALASLFHARDVHLPEVRLFVGLFFVCSRSSIFANSISDSFNAADFAPTGTWSIESDYI